MRQRDLERRINKLQRYIKKHGMLKIAYYCGFETTDPIKRWIERK